MKIAILAFDGISPFMLSTPLAVFDPSVTQAGLEVCVCAGEGRFVSSGGMSVTVEHDFSSAAQADLVILPGWRDVDEPVPEAMIAVLNAAYRRGAMVAGLCLGAFGLGQAGLLDGRRATTHWFRLEDFSQRFPRVQVDRKSIFVDEGQVVTSAGIAAGLDCCLHLLARFQGVSSASTVARHLVVAPQRSGQAPQTYDRVAPISPSETRVAELLTALWNAPVQAPALDDLAQQIGLSRRSLTRAIRARTGGSLGDWLRQARISRAQAALLQGTKGLENVATYAGFVDAQALRAAFREELAMTPTQWLARQQCR
jgi:transcriptional regulator GlxA family with amidase domain